MNSIIIQTAVWKRPDIFEVWTKNIANRISEISGDFNITVLCVGSRGDMCKDIAIESGFEYVQYKNQPLGAKFNFGAKTAYEMGADYLISLGSDDLICPAFLKYYINRIKWNYDFVAPLDCYFFDIDNNTLGYWAGYDEHRRIGEPCGAGRMISRDCIKMLDLAPWEPKRRHSIDWEMWLNIKKLRVKTHLFRLRNQGLMLLDIKKEGSNINSFSTKWEKIDIKELEKIPEL